jgi:hypothetical protein
MANKHVRIIDLIIERQPAGMAVATSPSWPDFYLVATADRLDEVIPDALQRFYRLKEGVEIEVLPIERDDHCPPAQWAAILASQARASA